jgi:hypothetical protein
LAPVAIEDPDDVGYAIYPFADGLDESIGNPRRAEWMLTLSAFFEDVLGIPINAIENELELH